MKPAPLGSQDWTRGTTSSPEILPSTISCPAPSSPLWFTTGSSPTPAFHYTSGSQPDSSEKLDTKLDTLYTNIRKALFKSTMFLFSGGWIFSFIDSIPTPLQIGELLWTPGWRITPDISDSLSQEPTQSPSLLSPRGQKRHWLQSLGKNDRVIMDRRLHTDLRRYSHLHNHHIVPIPPLQTSSQDFFISCLHIKVEEWNKGIH